MELLIRILRFNFIMMFLNERFQKVFLDADPIVAGLFTDEHAEEMKQMWLGRQRTVRRSF